MLLFLLVQLALFYVKRLEQLLMLMLVTATWLLRAHSIHGVLISGLLFHRTFLKRKLSRLQWMAIMLLTVGTTVSQVRISSRLLRSAFFDGFSHWSPMVRKFTLTINEYGVRINVGAMHYFKLWRTVLCFHRWKAAEKETVEAYWPHPYQDIF